MDLIVFDDHKWGNFFPITLTRPTTEIRVGILKLRQRISAYFDTEINMYIINELLKDVYSERHPNWQINKIQKKEEYLLINSRLLPEEKSVKQIKELKTGECLIQNDSVVAARLILPAGEIDLPALLELCSKLKVINAKDIRLLEFLWEAIKYNSEFITRDFKDYFYEKDNYFETEMGVTVLNPYDIWIGEGTEIKPGVVIDATGGPVVIDEDATIMPNAVIIGPAFIGKNTVIKVGAKIYEGTSIGPNCKVGGEVEETIIQAFSNKQHDGFLGHSYLGEWVNIGADTNNSDLKNNYQNVKVWFYPEKTKKDTNCRFVGSFIGDHTKVGINCSINTGTVIGVGCNLYGRDLISDFIPCFSWGEAQQLLPYKVEKFLETTKIVKERRKQTLSQPEIELYKKISQKSQGV